MNEQYIANIIAGLAFVISIITAYSQHKFNRYSLRPAHKIDIYSMNGSIKIVFQNVGNGVMKVEEITYYEIGKSINDKIKLSEWLKDCPVLANSEYNLDNTYVGSGMQYNLLSRTVPTQKALDDTWDKLKRLGIYMRYKDTFGEEYYGYYKLDVDYDVYWAAKGNRNIVDGKNKKVEDKSRKRNIDINITVGKK
ncbi:MAG: hypothetical protein E7299_03560 [Lachnospiraceae bacterium]|nr:hypothetical protein [Lachnospiraceae bacterium]